MNLFEVITYNDVLIAALGAVASLPVGYVAGLLVAKQTEKRKDLVLQVTGRRIIVESARSCPFVIQDTQGNELDNVYLINVRVWNRGKLHVHRADVSDQSPIAIRFEEGTKLLGNPIIFRGVDETGVSIEPLNGSSYRVDFECFNSDEWAELGFFVQDDYKANVSASGRIFGQKADFSVTMDDGKESTSGRVGAFLLVAFVLGSFPSLAVSIIWLIREYSLWSPFTEPESLPRLLGSLFAYGTLIPLLILSQQAAVWLKRRRHPKSYPIDEDYDPREVDNLGAMWGTALTGKAYRVSSSAREPGTIIIRNEGNSDSNGEIAPTGSPVQAPVGEARKSPELTRE